MRPLRNFLLLVTIVLSIQGLAHAQTSDEKRLSITKDVMDDFAHGGLASVRERFSAELKDSVSESDLKGAREELAGVAGAFQAQISQTTRTVQGAPIYVSKSQFEHFKVELKLMFDDSNRSLIFGSRRFPTPARRPWKHRPRRSRTSCGSISLTR